jgi:sporulation protein YlmC with PRC-barrel domain
MADASKENDMITRSLALAVVMGSLAASPALAQSEQPQTGTPNTSAPATKPAAPVAVPTNTSDAKFIPSAQAGDWRASKIVGVNIYGADNKSIGEVSDVVISKDGAIKAVVIGVGGFLGVGGKNVAVPFSAISWMDTPLVAAATSSAQTDATGSINSSPTPAPATTPAATPAAPAVYDYPDHGVLKMSKEELQAAPAFTYASEKQ